MSNVISDRIAFFLKDHPPFSFLPFVELTDLSLKISVKFCEEGEILFKEKQSGYSYCFILRKGKVNLTQNDAGNQYLVDICEPGDIFGVRSILSGHPYVMTATCEEDSLVYLLEKQQFLPLLKTHHRFSMFFAAGYASGQAVVRNSERKSRMVRTQSVEPGLDYTQKVLTCSSDISIYQAAQKMKISGVGSILIVDHRNFPVGILTDKDLRNKVLADQKDPSEPVSMFMSSPVKTIGRSFTLSEVQIEMIRSGIHHLVVTEDGSDKSPVQGIVSDHDIMFSQENHPAALVKAIRYSNDPTEWKKIRNKTENLIWQYLDQELSITLVTNLVTTINDVIIEKSIELAINEIPEAATLDFCWLSLGSEGREEQLLRTDQDNAILFKDIEDNTKAQQSLLKVGKRANEILEYCGFEKCPAEIMARNPQYCQPLSKWKSYFKDWIIQPDPKSLMNATIFFDFRCVYGNKKLADDLESYLSTLIQKENIFLNHFAKNALQNPPPLSFFKNLVVERSGEHKDEFDIKKRAMMPISDAARLLSLQKGIKNTQNTIKRFEKLIEIEPENEELYQEAIQAYEIFIRVRTLNGLKDQDSGRYIDLSHMTRLEKKMMKNAFLPIKELQDMIEVRFQLSYFS